MKLTLMVKMCIIFSVLVSTVSLGWGNIQGSAHDFSSKGWSNGEICLPCHTPHNAMGGFSPLWNHQVTTTTFVVYSSPTLKGTPGQPRGVSKLCLSCHDGTVAVDSFGTMTGSEMIAGTVNLGFDLSNDHPISIRWNHQTDFITSGACIKCHNPRPSDINPILPFYDRYIECATCHDVHNKSGFPSLLRMTMDKSALCIQCHGK